MRTGRSEALLLLRKWLDESTPLYCEIGLSILPHPLICGLPQYPIKRYGVRLETEPQKLWCPSVGPSVSDMRIPALRPSNPSILKLGSWSFSRNQGETDNFDRLTFMERRTAE